MANCRDTTTVPLPLHYGDVHKINFHGFDPWLDFVCAFILKFIYSEKATKFCKISILYLSNVVTVKSTADISQNLVAFSEYMNFTWKSWAELYKSDSF